MTDQELVYEGDFVRVASTDTPTEAHVMHGVLTAAGLHPHIADAEVARVWSWMTPAIGGVRVLVPEAEASAAREVLAEYAAGQLVLPGEEIERPEFETLRAPVFNPDRAMAFGLLLTPVFGVAAQIFNASVIGPSAKRLAHWIWLVIFMAATVACVALLMAISPGPFVLFRSGLVLLPLTAFWYIFWGQKQTRLLLSTYGPRYRKRTLLPAAILSAIAAMAIGLGLNALG